MIARILAASAFLPPIALCLLWSALVRDGQRGPAGGLGALIVLLPVPICLALAVRLLRGRMNVWAWPVRVAAAADALLVAWLLFFAPAARRGYLHAQGQRTRSNLSVLRAHLMREVKAGRPPPRRLSDLVPARIEIVPLLSLPGTGHPRTREVRLGRSTDIQDSGKWLYVNEPRDRLFGMIRIDCTHTDRQGLRWNAY